MKQNSLELVSLIKIQLKRCVASSTIRRTKNRVFSEADQKINPVSGLLDEQAAALAEYKPSLKITKDGDTYTVYTTTPEKTKETKFKSGVEFDEIVRDKIPIKSTYTVDGNTIKQTVVTDKGTGIFLREYNGDELVVTLSSPKFDVIAKRWYKA